MNKEDLKQRTKRFALDIMKLVEELPNTKAGNVISYQITKSGTSVAANYRASCRARSTADFISKMGIVEEESDETLFWLELIVEGNLLKKERVQNLMKEANELTAIFTASVKTVKQNNPKTPNKKQHKS